MVEKLCMEDQKLHEVAFSSKRRLTESSQKFMASRQSPQLYTDGHLNGQEREILFLLSCLQLYQHLVELEMKKARKEARVRKENVYMLKCWI